jgi:hypothetical protein
MIGGECQSRLGASRQLFCKESRHRNQFFSCGGIMFNMGSGFDGNKTSLNITFRAPSSDRGLLH